MRVGHVGINIVGHASSPYLATVFGGLGIFAYCVWLLHTSARRRDALRAFGMLRNIAPAYGLLQWKREPAVTWRAHALAIAQELIGMIDAHGWALLINAEIQPPGPAMPPAASSLDSAAGICSY